MMTRDKMTSHPRTSKPRLLEAYTDEQLIFLRSHVGDFETRTCWRVALDRANEFLVRFGMLEDLILIRCIDGEVSKYTIGTRIPTAERDGSFRKN